MTDCRLTSLGLVNALGSGVSQILPTLMQGDQSLLSCDSESIPGRSVMVGRVTATIPAGTSLVAHVDSRNSRLLMAAYDQIADDVSRAKQEYGAGRIGVVLGSSTSGIGSAESALCRSPSQYALDGPSYHYAQQEIGAVSEFLSLESGVRGPALTVSTACSSSAKVFATGRNLIKAGICDAVLVGGADSLCRLTLNGFAALDLLSDSPCNPMSRNRKGITIGEGAAVFLMEKKAGGIQLLGVGESSDAHHMSTPDPEAKGAIAAMRDALHQARVSPDQIGYLNLHGTGTAHNDAMESRAVDAVFGRRILAGSTKQMVGHMLGASGATEVGFLWMILSQNGESKPVPPHCWDGEIDSEITNLQLAARGDAIGENSRDLMSTSFGFGGSNCAVVVGIR